VHSLFKIHVSWEPDQVLLFVCLLCESYPVLKVGRAWTRIWIWCNGNFTTRFHVLFNQLDDQCLSMSQLPPSGWIRVVGYLYFCSSGCCGPYSTPTLSIPMPLTCDCVLGSPLSSVLQAVKSWAGAWGRSYTYCRSGSVAIDHPGVGRVIPVYNWWLQLGSIIASLRSECTIDHVGEHWHCQRSAADWEVNALCLILVPAH